MLLKAPEASASYYLRVLSHLVSKPRGYPIFDFTSLTELLVRVIDCLSGVLDCCDLASITYAL